MTDASGVNERRILQLLVTDPARSTSAPRLLSPDETMEILGAIATERSGADRSRLFTLEDVEERLKISRAEVYRLKKTKQLKTVNIGRLVRVSAAALAEYIESLETGDELTAGRDK